MSFNKNTWSKDYTGAKGIKLLGADDARRKGCSPEIYPQGVKAAAGASLKTRGGERSAAS